MRIAKVRVEGFRCLEDVEVEFSEITTFIGPNGAGKSSILRALDWFFNGGTLIEEDVFSGSTEKKISVRVDFNHLTNSDREKLEKYAPPGVDFFSAWKIWDNGAEKITGKANNIAENRKLLRLIGETEVDWPSGDLADKALALPDDLEHLLAVDWLEWETSRAALVTQGLGFIGKDGDTYLLAAKNAGGTQPPLLDAFISRTRSSVGI